jgi:hypothetical protein
LAVIRDYGHGAIVADHPPDGFATMGLVGNDRQWGDEVAEERGQDRRVVDMATGQGEGERATQPVDHGMDFRRPPAA